MIRMGVGVVMIVPMIMVVVMVVVVVVVVMMIMAVGVRQRLFFSRSLRSKTLNGDLACRIPATLAHNGLPVRRWIIRLESVYNEYKTIRNPYAIIGRYGIPTF